MGKLFWQAGKKIILAGGEIILTVGEIILTGGEIQKKNQKSNLIHGITLILDADWSSPDNPARPKP